MLSECFEGWRPSTTQVPFQVELSLGQIGQHPKQGLLRECELWQEGIVLATQRCLFVSCKVLKILSLPRLLDLEGHVQPLVAHLLDTAQGIIHES